MSPYYDLAVGLSTWHGTHVSSAPLFIVSVAQAAGPASVLNDAMLPAVLAAGLSRLPSRHHPCYSSRLSPSSLLPLHRSPEHHQRIVRVTGRIVRVGHHACGRAIVANISSGVAEDLRILLI